jgi:sugar-specific transcriptional regulator TrmB
MSAIDQLQQIGLNKYEAEAYYTLLAEGPLTGYELGKRSQVPLSKSYEVLERLTQKGLALVQPGDPPRYMAENPERFLGQVRQSMTTTLDYLANSLTTILRSNSEGEFWVLRGQQHVLARARAIVTGALRTISLCLPPVYNTELADVLAFARERGCHISKASTANQGDYDADVILLLVDDREALAGTLTPAGRCQAVVSANPALVSALTGYFAQQSQVENLAPPTSTVGVSTRQNDQQSQLDWVAWEDRKQRRLWRPGTDDRVA